MNQIATIFAFFLPFVIVLNTVRATLDLLHSDYFMFWTRFIAILTNIIAFMVGLRWKQTIVYVIVIQKVSLNIVMILATKELAGEVWNYEHH